MKTSLLFIPFLLVLGCGSSIKLATPEQMKHEFIREYPGISKNQIFERSLKWIAQNFKSAKQVIDFDDKEAGLLVAKGIIPVTEIEVGDRWSMRGLATVDEIGFTLTMDMKEGKAKYEYTNITPYGYGGKELVNIKTSENVHVSAHQELAKLTEIISKAILNKSDF